VQLWPDDVVHRKFRTVETDERHGVCSGTTRVGVEVAETGRVLLVGTRIGCAAELARHLRPALAVDAAPSSALRSDGRVERALGYDAVLLSADALAPESRTRIVEATVGWLRARDPIQRIVVLVPAGDREATAAALAAGAWDVLPTDLEASALAERLRVAASLHQLARPQPESLFRASSPGAPEPLEATGLIGESPGMRAVRSLVRRLAATDVPVLITGENGTGKELAAFAIHERSPRAHGPFVAINCGAVPETLLETELFGHERGAFTGAHQARVGRVEAAQGGTLFLDEIGELALHLQAKLLRFLETYTFERVGGDQLLRVDVRVISATNRDLAAGVKAGTFREDLYYRINVFSLHMPPLRERDGDVILLAKAFLEREVRAGARLRGFTPEAIAALARARWPGNVRELLNRVRRAVVVAEGAWITPGDLDLDSQAGVDEDASLRDARAEAEISAVRAALQRTGGNRSEAARVLGISRTQLYELLGRYGIEEPDPDKQEGQK
jgi:two-component system NtrC family response regulator